MTKKHIACLALGSNIGDAGANFSRAIRRLSLHCDVIAESKIYQSAPAGGANQADYHNAAILVETSLDPHKLLNKTRDIEIEAGRKTKGDMQPRSLDIDIIYYDELILDSNDLSLPHPRAHERDFVLKPIMDIAPDWTHPITGKSAEEMHRKLTQFCIRSN